MKKGGGTVRRQRRVFWLWCWLGVLVASCAQGGMASPTARRATLDLLKLTPAPALPLAPTPLLRLRRTPTLPASTLFAMTLAPTPLPLPVPAPDCYETPVGGLWCLGLLRNLLRQPIEDVLIRVYLVSADGQPLAFRDVPTAHFRLNPGQESPFGALFERAPSGVAGPVAVIGMARPATSDRVMLPVRDMLTSAEGMLFRVQGAILNTHQAPVGQVRLVVTLRDSAGRVTGFRQLLFPPDQGLQPEQRREFTLSVVAHTPGTARVEASAEGQRKGN